MPFSYPKYNAAIAAKLANGDFYRYLVDWRPEHAFASVNLENTTVYFGDIALPSVALWWRRGRILHIEW